jgi:serine/threonine protein kinase
MECLSLLVEGSGLEPLRLTTRSALDSLLQVVDFGFARTIDGPAGRASTFLGTPEYMCPELVKRSGYGTNCDVWGLGCLVCEMLTARSPFAYAADDTQRLFKAVLHDDPLRPPKPFRSLQDSLNPQACMLLADLLHKDPVKRLGAGVAHDSPTQAVRQHEWFSVGGELDWDKLEARQVPAPWTPGIKGKGDLTHFDEYGREDEAITMFHGDSAWSADF